MSCSLTSLMDCKIRHSCKSTFERLYLGQCEFVLYPNIVLSIIDIKLGRRTEVSNERIKNILNRKPRTLEEMDVAMGESMIEQGVVTVFVITEACISINHASAI